MATITALLENGISPTSGYWMFGRLTVGSDLTSGGFNVWEVGDTWSITINFEEVDYTFGTGRLTGQAPAFCRAFGEKLYFVSGDTLFFSDVGSAIDFEQQFQFAGFIQLSNTYAGADRLMSLASYQNGLAVFARKSVQIWDVDPDPGNYNQRQVLDNIGTVSGLSVQSVGDLDTFFLSDTGVRSLHVRDSSNNAVTLDVGSPIDTIIQSVLNSMTEAQKEAACSAIEPTSNRYWLYLDGNIYVLSYFISAGIAAWSVYKPTYGANQTVFVPQKFVTYNNQVYARTNDGKVIVYGGSDNNTYDDCIPSWKTPPLSAKKPATRKQVTSVDFACEGSWMIKLSTDPNVEPRNIAPVSESSFRYGTIAATGNGTHITFAAEGRGSGYARFSMAIIHFEEGDAS